jgi:hypothetical protein
MDLIIPGLARTGTKSLWRFFRTHHQVAASTNKEVLRLYELDKNYCDRFDITEQTKMLFDGTPELTNTGIIEELQKHPDIDNIYQIWFDRDPKIRLKSLLKRLISLTADEMNTVPKQFFAQDMDFQLKRAQDLLGKENVFVGKIDTINIERHIEKFLGIEDTNIVMPWDRNERTRKEDSQPAYWRNYEN